jgi:hypothetical protein
MALKEEVESMKKRPFSWEEMKAQGLRLKTSDDNGNNNGKNNLSAAH